MSPRALVSDLIDLHGTEPRRPAPAITVTPELYAEYTARLAERCEAFVRKSPSRYQAIHEATIAGLLVGCPLVWRRDGLPKIVQEAWGEAIVEAVRRANNWPTFSTWLAAKS